MPAVPAALQLAWFYLSLVSPRLISPALPICFPRSAWFKHHAGSAHANADAGKRSPAWSLPKEQGVSRPNSSTAACEGPGLVGQDHQEEGCCRCCAQAVPVGGWGCQRGCQLVPVVRAVPTAGHLPDRNSTKIVSQRSASSHSTLITFGHYQLGPQSNHWPGGERLYIPLLIC